MVRPRPGTLFRGLVLAEFCDRPLAETFFRVNDFPGRVVGDPFMGGGTPLPNGGTKFPWVTDWSLR